VPLGLYRRGRGHHDAGIGGPPRSEESVERESRVKWFWIGWILLFIGGESAGLFIIKGGTFSEFVWKIERYVRGQSIAHWSFGHLAIAMLFLWLFFHFAFRMWT